jgi:hypothetical protein
MFANGGPGVGVGDGTGVGFTGTGGTSELGGFVDAGDAAGLGLVDGATDGAADAAADCASVRGGEANTAIRLTRKRAKYFIIVELLQ